MRNWNFKKDYKICVFPFWKVPGQMIVDSIRMEHKADLCWVERSRFIKPSIILSFRRKHSSKSNQMG